MADILQDFPIAAPPTRVYGAITRPAGLDQWWTLASSGRAEVGTTYDLDFGPGYDWQAVVTQADSPWAFELRMTRSDQDWDGTTVGFLLEPTATGTQVRFWHRGWPEPNEHYRVSSHCWALYLRLLRRYVELGESVRYEERLGA